MKKSVELVGHVVGGTSKQECWGPETVDGSQILVDDSHMDQERDSPEAVTRSIFMWLRGTDAHIVKDAIAFHHGIIRARAHNRFSRVDVSDVGGAIYPKVGDTGFIKQMLQIRLAVDGFSKLRWR